MPKFIMLATGQWESLDESTNEYRIQTALYGLAEDGTVWKYTGGVNWRQISHLPESDNVRVR